MEVNDKQNGVDWTSKRLNLPQYKTVLILGIAIRLWTSSVSKTAYVRIGSV